MWPPHPAVHCVPDALSPVVNQKEHEAENLSQFNIDVKIVLSFTDTPLYVTNFRCIIKRRYNFSCACIRYVNNYSFEVCYNCNWTCCIFSLVECLLSA